MRWLRSVLQRDQRRAHELALKTVAGREGLGDQPFGRGLAGVGQLMQLGIVWLAGNGAERNQSHTPGDIAAGVLKIFQLLDQLALAGTDCGLVKRVNVVQYSNEDLQP